MAAGMLGPLGNAASGYRARPSCLVRRDSPIVDATDSRRCGFPRPCGQPRRQHGASASVSRACKPSQLSTLSAAARPNAHSHDRSEPFGDRSERSGRVTTARTMMAKHRNEPMADPAAHPRIAHPASSSGKIDRDRPRPLVAWTRTAQQEAVKIAGGHGYRSGDQIGTEGLSGHRQRCVLTLIASPECQVANTP